MSDKGELKKRIVKCENVSEDLIEKPEDRLCYVGDVFKVVDEAKKDIKPIEFQEVVDSESSTVFNMPIAILIDMNALRKLNEGIKKWFGDSESPKEFFDKLKEIDEVVDDEST